MTLNRVRIGFIGCGNIAQKHAANFSKVDAEIAAFADAIEAKASSLAEKCGARAYGSFAAMLDSERLDAIMLCTPHVARLAPIKAVAERGLALFCEKPPAFTLEEARECARVIEQAGILNTCGFMYRWAEAAERVREWIAGQPINLCQITACNDVIPWARSGAGPSWLLKQDRSGGPMIEQGIHLIDTARYIVGSDITEVQALGSNLIESRSEELTIHDTMVTNLRFANGTVGNHIHFWSHRGLIFQWRFIGAAFDLTWEVVPNRVTGQVRGEKVLFEGKDDCYLTELQGFVRAVAARNQSLLRSSYADACKSFAATLAANESAATGKPQPVHWP